MNTAAADAASSVPLPEGVSLGESHGADAVLVDTPSARAEILLDGAQLISWVPAGESEVMWLSPTSPFGPGESARGGIPVVGPWFGPGRDLAQPTKHGWLRNVRWDLVEAAADGTDIALTLRTPAGVVALHAELRLRIGVELGVDLEITAGSRPLELETALHTYLAVGDVREIAIGGLEGAPYLDNNRRLVADVMESDALRLTEPCDRIVDSAAEVTIDDPVLGRRLVSTPRGTAKTVVWNPWVEGAREMDDIPDDAWTQFVCVEPAVAKDAYVRLEPGSSHTIGVTYRIER